jgi:hypothetical protein
MRGPAIEKRYSAPQRDHQIHIGRPAMIMITSHRPRSAVVNGARLRAKVSQIERPRPPS